MNSRPSLEKPSPLEPLTHREREILACLEKDLTNREIAEALTLAESSVKGYTQHIYSKLGVNGRREAVLRARELGLLGTLGSAVSASNQQPNSTVQPAGMVFSTGTALPVGTVTFLFTDIEGSTPLWEQHPDQMAAALQIHNSILRKAIESQGGIVFKIVGDSFQAAFATAPQALRAAIEGQKALQSAIWNELGPLKVRMGLHTGEAQLDPGGDEYAVSHTKNRVGRIHAIAFGGQILLSQETADLVVRQLPEDAWLKDLGEHHLKGMALPEHLFQVCAPGLVESFPPLPTSVQPAHNLPVQMTSFVGREKEIDRLRTHVVSSRLVTLTGAGGVGKTRLAIAVAEGLLDAFPRGAWLLELAPLGDPALIAPTIASLFGLRPDKGRTPREILLDYLRSKRLLLILDNCEHLIDGCAELADLILHACPEVHLLATSREALGLEGEVVFHVPSLSTPDPFALPALERLPEYASIRLFCERAQAVVPEFTLTQTNASLLAGICQRLDGIPLALELAAARLKVLNLTQIADRLDDRFRLLTGGSRRTLPRHQTLSALIDWSYELLSAPEQALFRCLSVFSGGWTLEAAQAVGGQDVLDLLTRLVDKSLIQVVRSLNSLNRFRMLETIRQYTQVRLVEARDADSARDRHLDYYMRLAEASEPRLNTGERLACLEELRPELENFRSALDWSLENEQLEKVIMGLRLASALWYLWHIDGYRAEARTWLEKGLAIPGTKEPLYIPVRIRAAFATGWMAMFQNDQETIKFLNESMALAQKVGDSLGYAKAEMLLADWISHKGLDDPRSALALLGDSIDKCRQVGDRFWLALALCLRGWIFVEVTPDEESARMDMAEGLSLFEQIGNRWEARFWVGFLGEFALRRSEYVLAHEYAEERLQVVSELKDKPGMIMAFEYLGQIARSEHDFKEMERIFQNSHRISVDLGDKWEMQASLRLIGVAALGQDDIQRAARIFTECVPMAREVGDQVGLAACLVHWAGIALASNQPAVAVQILATVDANLIKEKYKLHPDDQIDYDRYLVECRERLDPDSFASAWQSGSTLTLDHAILRPIPSTLLDLQGGVPDPEEVECDPLNA